MTEWIFQQAERAARTLLQRFWEAHSGLISDQTPVDQLATWLALHVTDFQSGDQPPGTFGYIDPDEQHIIWLRDDLSESLRRFTLAHELGHALLHCRGNPQISALQQELAIIPLSQRGSHFRRRAPEPSASDPCSASDVQDSLTAYYEQRYEQEQLGQGHIYDPRSQHEIAANVFAAELLMPLERLRHAYLIERVSSDALQRRFGVSHAALLTRLHDLLTREIDGGDSAHDTSPPTRGDEQHTLASRPARGEKAHKNYDEFQRTAIETATPALIIAGPGSGKTSTLIGRVEYLVQSEGVHPQQILALTFSRKAAQEMEERLHQVLGQESTVMPTVSTFHAFCADLLRRYNTLIGLRPDFALIDDVEGYFTLRQLTNAISLSHYQNLFAPDMYFNDLLQAISRAKDELVSPVAYAELAQRMLAAAQNDEERIRAERASEVAYIYTAYEDALRQRGDTDFGGLLVLTIELLRSQKDVREELQQQYQHILVDEFQDMNRASGVLLRELAGEQRRVWVVGDQNQSIYGFRGASPANIGNFQQDFPGAIILPLSRNYRSRPDLVQLAETFRCKLLTSGADAGKNQPARSAEEQRYVTFAHATDEASELAGLARDIHARHAMGYAYRDIAVLCRTRNQVQKVTRALVGAGLPVAQLGSLLEQEAIKNVLAIVLLQIDVSGMGLLRAARLSAHPLSQEDIEALLRFAHEQHCSLQELLFKDLLPPTLSAQGVASTQRLKELIQRLLNERDLWSLLSNYLFLETSLMRDLLQEPESVDARVCLADYNTLLQLALHYDRQYQARLVRLAANEEPLVLSETLPTPTAEDRQQRIRGFLDYLRVLISLRQDSGERPQESALNGEMARDEIAVMTVHASKGLEFPVVYLSALVKRRFPLQGRYNPVPPPVGMLPPEREEKTANERDEAYLFYVGLTRARDHVILSYSDRYGKVSYKASPFFEVLTTSLSEERVSHLHWQSASDSSSEGRPEDMPDVDMETSYGRPSAAFIAAMKSTHITSNALETYTRCPRRYAYEQIYHFASEEQTYQLFWQSIQKTLESAQKQVMQAGQEEKRIPAVEQMLDLYASHWQEMGGPAAPFAAMYEQHGREVVELFCRDLSQSGQWQLRPHYDVEIAGKQVRVVVDRLEHAPETGVPVRFVRVRYGKRKEPPAADMRDALYMQVVRQRHPGRPVELHSHNMSTGERGSITIGKKKEQNLLEDAASALAGIERNQYPVAPEDASRCPDCPFFFVCPA